MIPTEPKNNHAAAAAWVQGEMTAAESLEFETHLATCAECQAEVAALRRAKRARQAEAAAAAVATPVAAPVQPEAPAPYGTASRRTWRLLAGGVLILLLGYALGWWIWQLAHH
jgi:cellulose synthase operon protein C